MKLKTFALSLLSSSIIVACASTPENSNVVDNLRAEYDTLAAQQDSNKYAPVALKEAEESY